MFSLLKRLAHTTPGRVVLNEFFAHMSFAIPSKRLRETDTLLAFRHPRPVHPFHCILVPKRAIAGLAELDPADTAFLSDLFAAVQSLVAEFELPAYRLVVNGGEYQDFPHLHFHLVSDSPFTLTPSPLQGGVPFGDDKGQEVRDEGI